MPAELASGDHNGADFLSAAPVQDIYENGSWIGIMPDAVGGFYLYAFGGLPEYYRAHGSGTAADPERFFPGMPTVSYDHPAYVADGFWRGPTWLNTANFALGGLIDYGFHVLADACRDTILGWCAANKNAIYERYNSRTGVGCSDAGFSWSAAFVIELILDG